MDWYRLYHTIRMYLCLSGTSRATYLKKHNVLYHIGENCMTMFRRIPLYPKLIALGDNVWIASQVDFITHDVIHRMLNNCYGDGHFQEKIGCINIKDNVFVGSNTTILPNVTIGSNTVIAAGSLVNKNIPGNGVYGGVPAKYICSLEEFIEKRMNLPMKEIEKNGRGGLSEKTVEECWKSFRDKEKWSNRNE